jgi:hypothetical protein
MMRERTLRHLMLIVGRTLQSLPENSEIKDEIHEICESLDVSRDRRGPYRVTWNLDGASKSIEIETEKFRFHERGDVPSRVEKRNPLSDGRTHNWNEAGNVWRDLLPDKQISFSTQLAPRRQFSMLKDHFQNDRFAILLSIALILISGITGQALFSWASCALMLALTKPNIVRLTLGTVLVSISLVSFENAQILACVFLMIIFYQADQIVESDKIQSLILVGSGSLLFVEPKFAIALLIVVVIELIANLVAGSRIRIAANLLVVAITSSTIYASGFAHLKIVRLTPFVILLGLAVAATALPRSIEKSMIRISAPLAIICLSLQQLVPIWVSVAVLLVWQVLLLQKPKYVTTDISTGVPVVIKSRRVSELP